MLSFPCNTLREKSFRILPTPLVFCIRIEFSFFWLHPLPQHQVDQALICLGREWILLDYISDQSAPKSPESLTVYIHTLSYPFSPGGSCLHTPCTILPCFLTSFLVTMETAPEGRAWDSVDLVMGGVWTAGNYAGIMIYCNDKVAVF